MADVIPPFCIPVGLLSTSIRQLFHHRIRLSNLQNLPRRLRKEPPPLSAKNARRGGRLPIAGGPTPYATSDF